MDTAKFKPQKHLHLGGLNFKSLRNACTHRISSEARLNRTKNEYPGNNAIKIAMMKKVLAFAIVVVGGLLWMQLDLNQKTGSRVYMSLG